jgi:hypothetical protein
MFSVLKRGPDYVARFLGRKWKSLSVLRVHPEEYYVKNEPAAVFKELFSNPNLIGSEGSDD